MMNTRKEGSKLVRTRRFLGQNLLRLVPNRPEKEGD